MERRHQEPVGLSINLLRRWESGPNVPDLSLRRSTMRLKIVTICCRSPIMLARSSNSDSSWRGFIPPGCLQFRFLDVFAFQQLTVLVIIAQDNFTCFN